MDADRRLVFPIGQYGGQIRAEAGGGTRFSIRRGTAEFVVNTRAGLLWRDAHGRIEDIGAVVWTRAALVERRADLLTPDQFAASYLNLLDLDLVAEVDPDGPGVERFARTYRLLPWAYGLGNTPEDPARFHLGYPPDHVAALPDVLWRIWRDGCLEPSLWDACLAAVEAERPAGRHLDPHRTVSDLLHTTHILLTLRVAYLDRARPGDHPADDPGRVDRSSPGSGADLMFPVGHDLGFYFPGGDGSARRYEIAMGRRQYGLPTDDHHRVWMAALTRGDDPPLTWLRYRNSLITGGIPGAVDMLAQLLDLGLLRRVPPDGDGAVTFARNHRLLPLATAVGNVAADTPAGRYALGLGAPPYYATELEYWLWLRCAVFDNLWIACCTLTGTYLAREIGASTPEECLRPVLLAAQSLTGHALAFLDSAWDRR